MMDGASEIMCESIACQPPPYDPPTLGLTCKSVRDPLKFHVRKKKDAEQEIRKEGALLLAEYLFQYWEKDYSIQAGFFHSILLRKGRIEENQFTYVVSERTIFHLLGEDARNIAITESKNHTTCLKRKIRSNERMIVLQGSEKGIFISLVVTALLQEPNPAIVVMGKDCGPPIYDMWTPFDPILRALDNHHFQLDKWIVFLTSPHHDHITLDWITETFQDSATYGRLKMHFASFSWTRWHNEKPHRSIIPWLKCLKLDDVEYLAKLLQDPLCDPSVGDNLALRIASAEKQTQLAIRLLKDPRVDPTTRCNQPLHAAQQNEDAELIEALLADDRVRRYEEQPINQKDDETCGGCYAINY